MLALAHATGCRPKLARLKSSDNLFRAARSFHTNYGYSTRLERLDGARADSAAQYGVAILQRFDESGVTMGLGGFVARSASVFVATCIGTGLDESHLPILGFENEELAAASEVGGNTESIVRWYGDLHVRFSLTDTD